MLGLWLTSYTLTVNSTTLKIKAEETVETQGDAKSDSSVRSSRRENKRARYGSTPDRNGR